MSQGVNLSIRRGLDIILNQLRIKRATYPPNHRTLSAGRKCSNFLKIELRSNSVELRKSINTFPFLNQQFNRGVLVRVEN